jgi:hypothetical protein
MVMVVSVLSRMVRAAMLTMVVLMAVVPQLRFVEQKEKHQPNQQRQKKVFGCSLALKGFWQQVHEGRGQQGTCGQAQHVLGVTRQRAKTQSGSKPNTADSGSQRAEQNR